MTWQAWVRFGVLLFVAAVVQAGILNGIVLGGAHPDGFLLLAVVAGIVAGPQQGAVLAFVTGLVADLFVVTPYGLSALCFVLVAFAVGLAAGVPGARASTGFRLLVAVFAGIGATLLYAVLETLLGQPHPSGSQVLSVCAVVAVANFIGVLPLSRLLARLLKAGTPAQHADHPQTGLLGGSASNGRTAPTGGRAVVR